MKRKGLNLIGLILTLTIIGLLIGTTFPSFRNIWIEAIEASEEAMLGSLKTAVHINYLKNIVEKSGEWPKGNPLELLDPIPQMVAWPVALDDMHWRINHNERENIWCIYSPLYNGEEVISPPSKEKLGTKGYAYVYAYDSNNPFGLLAGEWQRYGHGY